MREMAKGKRCSHLPIKDPELSVRITAPAEYADFGTFTLDGKTCDGRSFTVKGNWDIGAHPEGYWATKFSSRAKFSEREKTEIRKSVKEGLKRELNDAFEEAYGYALESGD